MPDLDTFSNIYTFRIGNSVFNNNHNNSLYGYVNDFILFNYIITEKEIDEMGTLLENVITKLEETLGTDLDGDGKVPMKK